MSITHGPGGKKGNIFFYLYNIFFSVFPLALGLLAAGYLKLNKY